MGKLWKIIYLVLLIFLCGCGNTKQPGIRTVSRVEVVCDRGYTVQRKCYTNQEDMHMILNHLRLRKNLGPAETDPERVLGTSYYVRVLLSDNTVHHYQQRAGRYFSSLYGPWQRVDPMQATELQELFLRLSGEKYPMLSKSMG